MTKFEEAMKLIAQGKLEEAKNLLEEILKTDPKDVNVLYNLGCTFTDLGQPEKAIVILERCLKYKPDFSNTYVALGVAYRELEDFDNAKKFFFDALKIDPKNSFALKNLGRAFGVIGDVKKSMDYLKKSYKINPMDPETVYSLGYTYEQMKEYEKANNYYNKLMRMDAPSHLKKFAKRGLTKIRTIIFRAICSRTDAVFYMVDALEMFKQKSKRETRDIVAEIEKKGQEGVDLSNLKRTYKLKSLDGNFTGLQLICYMYVGAKELISTLEIGTDLSEEYSIALKLFNTKRSL